MLATNEDSEQTAQTRRLIWVFNVRIHVFHIGASHIEGRSKSSRPLYFANDQVQYSDKPVLDVQSDQSTLFAYRICMVNLLYYRPEKTQIRLRERVGWSESIEFWTLLFFKGGGGGGCGREKWLFLGEGGSVGFGHFQVFCCFFLGGLGRGGWGGEGGEGGHFQNLLFFGLSEFSVLFFFRGGGGVWVEHFVSITSLKAVCHMR